MFIVLLSSLRNHQCVFNSSYYHRRRSSRRYLIKKIIINLKFYFIITGLPLAVTIALAFSVNKMKDENNLVKELHCCETMGGATNICSDKTGTLTQNIMSVERIYIEDQVIQKPPFHKITSAISYLFAEAVCYNSSSNTIPEKNAKTGKWVQIGNKTECALLELADFLGFPYD
jgi:Ca2+ transporting ATPase